MEPPTFWTRVRKARLVRVLAVYLGAAWLILQVSYVLQDAAGLPAWVSPFAVLLLLIGLAVVLATAWVQSHPPAAARADADAGSRAVPGSWDLALRELAGAVRRGRMPHLTWARSLAGGIFAFWLLFGFAGVYVVVQDRGRSFAPEPAHAALAGPGVAVVPFTAAGADLELLREGMVDLLSTNLDGVGGFRAIASRTVLARWREAVGDDGAPDLPTVLEIARRAEASFAVVGGAVSVGPQVRLVATVYDLAASRDLGQAVAEGLPDDLLRLVDELTVEIVRALVAGGSPEIGELRAESILTASVPALRAYLRGEALYRRSDFTGAIRAFEAAVAADSTFALALFRLAQAHGWRQAGSGGGYIRAAQRFGDRLSQRDALLLQAYATITDGTPQSAATARQAVQRYPDDPDAWYMLGDLYYHSLGPLLADPIDAERALDRAAALDPEFAPYYIHLLDLALNRGDEMRARELLDVFARIADGSVHLHRYRLAYDLVFGDSVGRAGAVAALDTVPTEVLSIPSLARPLALAAAEVVAKARHGRTGASIPLAPILLMRGKVGEYRRLTEDESNPYLTLIAAFLVAEDGAPWIEATLAFDPTEPQPTWMPAAIHAARHGHWARFDSIRSAVASEAARLNAADDSAQALIFDQAAAFLDAYGATRGLAPEDAIRALTALRRDRADPVARGLDDWVRLRLAELLAESARPRDAVPYLRSLIVDRWTPAHFWLGELYERIGEPDSARVAYADFLLAWEEADEDLPMLHAAREGLRRVLGDAAY